MDLPNTPDCTESLASSPPAVLQSFGNINYGVLEVQSPSQSTIWKACASGFGASRELELADITEAYTDSQTSFHDRFQEGSMGPCFTMRESRLEGEVMANRTGNQRKYVRTSQAPVKSQLW